MSGLIWYHCNECGCMNNHLTLRRGIGYCCPDCLSPDVEETKLKSTTNYIPGIFDQNGDDKH